MPFFPQAYLAPEATFFQILSELDRPQQKACAPRHSRPQTFTPRFDVSEVPEAYELYGELPGIEQADISIEFSDAQTLVIKGKSSRTSSTAQPTSTEVSKDSDNTSEHSHNATVEDEYDEADTPLATPATTATVAEDNTTSEQPNESEKTAAKPKYWVAERKVGSFARSFTFSHRIEQDDVKAVLKNGILTVVVPKSQKSKKVAVSVN